MGLCQKRGGESMTIAKEENIFPKVVENDDGIRPAGKSDECFYCQRKIGQSHESDCVIVTKRIKVSYVFDIEVDVPHFWTQDDIEFHRNESSWCANNAISDIQLFMDDISPHCLCSNFRCEFIRTVDDTPKRKIKQIKQEIKKGVEKV